MRQPTILRVLDILSSQSTSRALAKRHKIARSTVTHIRKGWAYPELYRAHQKLVDGFLTKDAQPIKIPWEPPIPITTVYYNGEEISHSHAYELIGRELLEL